MGDKLVVCTHCLEEIKSIPYSSPFQFRGLFTNFKVPSDMVCPKCKSKLMETSVTMEEIKIIYAISHDNAFIQAMIELKQKDIIEYELKMSQFRTQAEQQESIQNTQKQQESNIPKCPTCGSQNIKKISTSAKIGGAMMFGLLSKTAKSQWVCDNCGYKW